MGCNVGLSSHDRLVWCGFQLRRLLEQSVEQETASSGSTTVEAKRELVQIVIELGGTDRSMVNPQPPTIEEGCHPVNLGHDYVGGVSAGGDVLRLVLEADFRETIVGSPAVGSNHRSRAHGRLDERNEALGGDILDSPHADTTGASTTDFGGDCDDRFLVCFPIPNANFAAADVCFVNLHLAVQKIPAWSYHGTAKFMQPCPGRLITAQAEYPL